MAKYAKYTFVALLVSGLLALSYGGCGGSSGDSSNGNGGGTPTNPPATQAPPTNIPPTDAPPTDAPPTDAPPTDAPPTDAPPTNPPGACEGDAFINTGTACLTDFISQNSQSEDLTCRCNASEAGDFILTVNAVFGQFMKVNIEFPDIDDPDNPFPSTFSFDWEVVDCDTLELFTTPLFTNEDPISIGTIDDLKETAPDQLTFTANISEQLLSTLFGSSGQSASCDFCSIDRLPDCAPEL